jgi:hypothetical protein
MKRTLKLAGAMLIVVGVIALGISQYISQDERGRTTEIASGALSVVGAVAARLSADNNEYQLVIANRVGMGRIGTEPEAPMAVQAVLSVRGGDTLSRVCATMPRVRDAINGVVTDRIGPKLRAGRVLAPDELAAEGEILRAALNRLVQAEAFSRVRIVLKGAHDVQEGGCHDATRTANVNNGNAAAATR